MRALSPSVELSIYRIVQEALTNVVKHAGPAAVRSRFRDETDALVLEVNDDGRGITSPSADPIDPASAETHHGIVGMRERVALFDGSLLAGPRPEGGFRVIGAISDRVPRLIVIGVVVVDDQALVRAGFRVLVDSSPDLQVLGDAADGVEAVRVVRDTAP